MRVCTKRLDQNSGESKEAFVITLWDAEKDAPVFPDGLWLETGIVSADPLDPVESSHLTATLQVPWFAAGGMAGRLVGGLMGAVVEGLVDGYRTALGWCISC
jgi:hypothetical protein